MRRVRTLALATVCSLGLAGPAAATTDRQVVYTAVSGQEMLDIFESKNLIGKLGVDDYGDPEIEVETQGVRYYIEFYDCDGTPKSCNSVLFRIGFTLDDVSSTGLMNAWNQEKRYTRAYIDDEGDPIMEMDLLIEGGVGRETIRTMIDYWEQSVEEFLVHIEW